MYSDTRSPIGFLPAGWKLDSLKNITTKIGSGSTPRGGEAAYLEERIEYAFIRSQNVFDFQFSESEVKYISDSDANKLKNVHLQRDDLLLNITGDGITFARCCIVPEEILPAAVNQHVSIIRLDQEKCLPGYLLAYLCLPQTKDYISNFNAGGSRRAITKGHIETFDIPLPPMSIQRSIQRFTFDVMHKVRANTQLNQNLEKIAQAIFKSWFVDFEPTKAKIAAREALLAENPDATPEQISTAEQQAAIQAIAGAGYVIPTQQLQTIADLFPNQLVESELGEIPDGWEVSEIGNEVKVCGGGTPSTKNAEFWDKGNIAWTTPKDLSGKTSKILIDTDRKITELGLKKISSGLLPVNTVLLSSRAPVGYLALAKIPLAVNQGYIAMVCDKNITPEFVINWCDSVMDEIKQRASGTTFSEISKKNFKLIKITLPPKTLCEVYSLITKPLYNLISSNETESEMLKNLRDSILPKLLNGEIGSSLMEMSGE